MALYGDAALSRYPRCTGRSKPSLRLTSYLWRLATGDQVDRDTISFPFTDAVYSLRARLAVRRPVWNFGRPQHLHRPDSDLAHG